MLRVHPINLPVRLVLETHEVSLSLFEALNACVAFQVDDRRFIVYASDPDPGNPGGALPLLTFDGNEMTGDPVLLELAQHAIAVLQDALKQRGGA